MAALRSPVLCAAAAALLASLAPALAAQGREQVWPMADGSHEVLHSFQNPFSFSFYFHEGVDLRGNLTEVVAARSGTVRYVNQNDAGGTLLVEVEPGGEADSYLHVRIDPWLVGDEILAGDRVGLVSNTYFSGFIKHHVHLNRFRTWAGGSGYVGGRVNMLHPLAFFSGASNRDPQRLQAAPQDANLDGSVFHVALQNEPHLKRPYAFGDTELLLEANDCQTSTLSWNQGLLGVGYWVEALGAGDDVASGEKPYRLARFDDRWRGSHPNCDALLSTVMLAHPAYRVDYGAQDTGWDSFATYRLTKAAGFRGLASEVASLETWRTDARRGAGAPNGNGAPRAREIQEARFADGRYRAHALTQDFVGELDTPFDLVVDNFRPYVRALTVRDAASLRLRYAARWEFRPASGLLVFARRTPAPDLPPVAPGDVLRLELEFSEPMASAQLVLIDPPLGALPVLSSSQPAAERTLWSAELLVASVPAEAKARLEIAGTDLAGTTLHPFADEVPRATPFNKRTSPAPIVAPTRDTLHVVPLRPDRPSVRSR